MFLPRPARRARKYSVRDTTACPRMTWVHSSCRNWASHPVSPSSSSMARHSRSAWLSSRVCLELPGSASRTTRSASWSTWLISTRANSSSPPSWSSRDFRSAARFLLYVVRRTGLLRPGGSRSTKCLTLCRATMVLPVPGPPPTRAGPEYSRSTSRDWVGWRKTFQRPKSPPSSASRRASSVVVTMVAGRSAAARKSSVSTGSGAETGWVICSSTASYDAPSWSARRTSEVS